MSMWHFRPAYKLFYFWYTKFRISLVVSDWRLEFKGFCFQSGHYVCERVRFLQYSAGWFVNVCQASWNARQALKMTSVSRVVRWIVSIMWKGGPGGEITYAVYDIRASTELCSWLWLIFWKWVAYIVELLRICPISFNWCQWHNSKGKRLSYFHTVEQVYQLKLHWPYFQTEPQPNNLVSYLYVTIQQFQRLWVNAALIPIFQSRVKLNQRLLLISPNQRTIRQNWPQFILQKPVYPTLTPHFECSFSYLQNIS